MVPRNKKQLPEHIRRYLTSEYLAIADRDEWLRDEYAADELDAVEHIQHGETLTVEDD